ncbi:MAG: CHASE2 domain-containing protein [Snowella sp.]|nr:CHASE2 domain-containing protein [Snowella sp.]
MPVSLNQFEYQIGGSLRSNAPSYVKRKADDIFYHALKAGELCYVLNSRQMGKSSLRVSTTQRLQQDGTVCIFIDLTGMGSQDVTPEKWYAGIVKWLVSDCPALSNLQWRSWWREQRDLLSPVQCLNQFIREVLLVEVKQNIVVFIDEIDRVLSQSFPLDDFFALIRSIYQQRHVNPEYQRLSFALLGVATPNTLIQQKDSTPFNMGQAIALTGFKRTEVEPLTQGLKGIIQSPEAVMQEILNWTGGQPFLTQKLCKTILDHAHLQAGDAKTFVEKVVSTKIIDNWEAQDEPEHLRTIRDRLLRNEKRTGRLLGLYQQILQQGSLPFDGSAEQMELKLTGLVVDQDGKLRPYNKIYQHIFNLVWVERKLTELRPYAHRLAAWLNSHKQDSSTLLQGQDLQDALTWSIGKQVSDLDYQYLVASQAFANQKTKATLAATEEASELLAIARQKAKQTVGNMRISGWWIPKVGLGLGIPIALLRLIGYLQGAEWNLWDQFVRWQPLKPLDSRIVIVTITESDIQKYYWPISDQTLAQALTTIKSQNPSVIGLDIVRNVPIEPGHQDLLQVFQSTPNLFGIEKVIDPPVPPPPLLRDRDQVGFADVVPDLDRRVRRALLSTQNQQKAAQRSLAAQLALFHLEKQGISLQPQANNQFRLGKALYHRFTANDGAYVRADAGGYQLLVNFRGSEKSFYQLSLEDVLNNRIPTNLFRDRIVLIGITAESLKDLFDTPHSGGLFPNSDLMPGVILHATIVSQILSAALEGQPLLRSWSEPVEYGWIILWALLGAGVSWWLKSPSTILVSIATLGTILITGSYLAFLQGWWIPVIPPLMGLGGTAIVIIILTNRERDQLLCQCTLAELLAVQSSSPVVFKIAVAYLQQSESKENQIWINQQLNQTPSKK